MALAAAAARMSTDVIPVIDPANRTGKIRVPRDDTQPTVGLAEWDAARAAGREKDVSLCMLWQRGRCLAGDACHQIHVDRSLVERLRRHAAAGGNCCAEHGHAGTDAEHARRIMYAPPVRMQTPQGIVDVPARNFGRTLALERAVSSGAVVQSTRLCRLQQLGRCKYGRDCKNLHLCQQWLPVALGSGPPPPHAGRTALLAPLAHPAPAADAAAPMPLRFAAPAPAAALHHHHVIATAAPAPAALPRGAGLARVLRTTLVRPSHVPPLCAPAPTAAPLPAAAPAALPLPAAAAAGTALLPAAAAATPAAVAAVAPAADPLPPTPLLLPGGGSCRRSRSEDAFAAARELARAELEYVRRSTSRERSAEQADDEPPALAPPSPAEAVQAAEAVQGESSPLSPPDLVVSPVLGNMPPPRGFADAADSPPAGAADAMRSPLLSLRRFRGAFAAGPLRQSLPAPQLRASADAGAPPPRGGCGSAVALLKLRLSADAHPLSGADHPALLPRDLLGSPTVASPAAVAA